MAEAPSDESPWPCDKGLSVMTGHSVVVRAPWPVARVSVSDPKVADVRALTPDRIMVMGKSIGTTDLMIWNEKEEMRRVQVAVSADIEWLQLELARLLPQSKLEVRQSHDLIVLSGTLRTTEQIQHLHKFMEYSFFLQKFLMCADLRYFAVFYDDEAIAISERREPVCNGNRSAALCQPFERILDFFLGLCVHRRCRLVEDQYFWIAKYSPCN